jgi:hypothetical protein
VSLTVLSQTIASDLIFKQLWHNLYKKTSGCYTRGFRFEFNFN